MLDLHLTPHKKKNGSLIWVDERSHDIEIDGQPARLVLVTDVTERVQLENAVSAERDRYQALVGRIRDAQEQDRLHLSREIHDALGQELTGLKFRLQQMKGSSGVLAEEFSSATASIDKLISKLRDIAAHLRPPVLDHLALPDALEWLAEDFGERAGIVCTAHVQHSLPSVADDIKLAVFRVCQEALTNVQRHSGATEASVRLASRNGDMVVTIEDNGVGFGGGLNTSGSLGLLGMRERAQSMGGSLTVESAPGEGTRIHLVAPLQ
jgi:signal transduction histidine kinase